MVTSNVGKDKTADISSLCSTGATISAGVGVVIGGIITALLLICVVVSCIKRR
jgi:hypothetical protein